MARRRERAEGRREKAGGRPARGSMAKSDGE